MCLKKISPDDLICMDDHATEHEYRVDLAYAREDNLLFGEQIYKSNAKLYLFKDLAHIVLQAAQSCFNQSGNRFILYDGLRTSDAQEAMMQTQRVRDNPHWLEPPRLLSPAGTGGHPRAMAIDIGLETHDGKLLEMGSAFDALDETAHRAYPHPKHTLENRKILDTHLIQAAKNLNIPFMPLPQEWWDFRFPKEIYEQYAPISEYDIPDDMKLLDI